MIVTEADSLTDEEVAESWILACQAVAVSAKVHVEIP
tara:strand:+ start:365 stop:475 length:111 start_codon:yes stop_codon:yes gene_type:complete